MTKTRLYRWSFILVIAFLASCTVIPMLSGTGTKQKQTDYSEDLKGNRPQFTLEEREFVTENSDTAQVVESIDSLHYIPVNDSVNMVLDSIASIRLEDNRVTGFTIMVYSSMSHEESRKALGKLYQIIPEDIKSDLVYQQPYFRVKCGKFMHEIHAYGTLKKIKEVFPSAIIVPETYKIVSSTDEK